MGILLKGNNWINILELEIPLKNIEFFSISNVILETCRAKTDIPRSAHFDF